MCRAKRITDRVEYGRIFEHRAAVQHEFSILRGQRRAGMIGAAFATDKARLEAAPRVTAR